MTDQHGASLERILRNLEVRIQKLETAARVKPGLQIDFPPSLAPLSSSTAFWPGSFTSPATVSGTVPDTAYNALRADIVSELHTTVRALLNAGYAAGWWPNPNP